MREIKILVRGLAGTDTANRQYHLAPVAQCNITYVHKALRVTMLLHFITIRNAYSYLALLVLDSQV